MNRDDIIRMAREAGAKVIPDLDANEEPDDTCVALLTEFAALVAAAEREACANVCEEQRSIEWVTASMPALIRYEPANLMAEKCAAAIRARGQE